MSPEGLQVFGPYRPLAPLWGPKLTAEQSAHMRQLVADVSARTTKSRDLTARYRGTHADHRAPAGFHLAWKEIVHPIVVSRSEGAYLIDVDGNRFLDFAMDYGVSLYGHSAPFIVTAVREQLDRGLSVGAAWDHTGPVSDLICELTGVERIAFVNSGTEAVMAALRLARAVTGRPKVAVFTGSFHGSFDGILGRTVESAGCAPAVPGVPASMIADLVLADYGSTSAFDVLLAHRDELAAVLVEPVQSRRPDLQPRQWLGELRELATRIGAALIFDEIITGFRLHQGGAQAWSGVRADMVTYGKALGGGLPLAAVAGSGRFMSAIDGGTWSYGDGSWPQVPTTLFTGTFFKHPLAMAAARAVLTRLREEGPRFQERLAARAANLQSTLNSTFEQLESPVRVVRMASLFRFTFGDRLRHPTVFFYNLLAQGVHIWEGRNCFVSAAHSQVDIDAFIDVVRNSALRMRAAGFVDPHPQGLSARRRNAIG